jgi:hypothetical protein
MKPGDRVAFKLDAIRNWYPPQSSYYSWRGTVMPRAIEGDRVWVEWDHGHVGTPVKRVLILEKDMNSEVLP